MVVWSTMFIQLCVRIVDVILSVVRLNIKHLEEQSTD
jgi:hypothetical protein